MYACGRINDIRPSSQFWSIEQLSARRSDARAVGDARLRPLAWDNAMDFRPEQGALFFLMRCFFLLDACSPWVSIEHMCAKIFTIANQKGGVGKTTTAINLSYALADQGARTVLVDLDPQANATSGLGLEKLEGGSLYGPLCGEGTALEKVQPVGANDRLFMIPSEVDMAAIEIELIQRDNYLVQLRQCLNPLRESGDYDAIILDCPPALGMLSMNSLAAADYLLIALQCEYLAMEGLGQILKVVDKLRDAGVNDGLELGGILMTMFDQRTNLAHQVVGEVRNHFGEKVFRAMIPRSIRLSEAPSFGQSIFEYDAHSSGANAYRYVAEEVIERFDLIK
jgi:chromosome partitioning protein